MIGAGSRARARQLVSLTLLAPARLLLGAPEYPGFRLRDLLRLEREVRSSPEWRRLRSEARSARAGARTDDRADALKYLDVDLWLRANILRGVRLGLHRAPPLRVLDIGCGAGILAYLCRRWGHDAVGLDRPLPALNHSERLVYAMVPEILGVRVIRAPVEEQRLPPLPGRYDLLTAFMICFNGHGTRDEWGAAEWSRFLRSALDALSPAGRLHLWFNPRAGEVDRYVDADVRALLVRCGGEPEAGRVTLRRSAIAAALWEPQG